MRFSHQEPSVQLLSGPLRSSASAETRGATATSCEELLWPDTRAHWQAGHLMQLGEGEDRQDREDRHDKEDKEDREDRKHKTVKKSKLKIKAKSKTNHDAHSSHSLLSEITQASKMSSRDPSCFYFTTCRQFGKVFEAYLLIMKVQVDIHHTY